MEAKDTAINFSDAMQKKSKVKEFVNESERESNYDHFKVEIDKAKMFFVFDNSQ